MISELRGEAPSSNGPVLGETAALNKGLRVLGEAPNDRYGEIVWKGTQSSPSLKKLSDLEEAVGVVKRFLCGVRLILAAESMIQPCLSLSVSLLCLELSTLIHMAKLLP